MEGNLHNLMELTEIGHSSAEYSAQKLADLAGITPRTLHYYDEIGLLVPAIRMGSGRRFYHTDQVVRLCQILWLRGLGFSLERVRAILKSPASNTTSVLRMQQKWVRQEIKRLQGVDRSIERAIQHLEGLPMSKQELECILKDSAENQVDVWQMDFHQLMHEVYGEENWEKATAYADTLSQEQRIQLTARSSDWNARFVQAVKQGLAASSEEVQALVHEGFELNEGAVVFSGTPKEVFLKGREVVKPGSAMAKPLEGFCPGYVELYYEASGIYAACRWPSES